MEKSVRVAVRVRPLSTKEKATARPSVVAVAPKEHQVTVRKKTYTFDRVFGQYASQKDVFKGVVQSVVDEALAGFNCTVFAYGQTGTGKTHTIQGKLSPLDENAGIIPRSVNYIFEKLQATKCEYSVRVSFLQLYNEELKDLLGENKKDKPLRLMEDAKRGGVYCQNLEEVTTLTASHVFELLEIGSKNRIMAETLLNDQSSRSHCIFTIRIHSKESNIPGEELIRSGTLNLVDLAGSECIGRSGARNVRAREAGNINQSLLTLGRVITALVDKHPHVPYRDSKLTRLLQESLGGRAMTTIIATLGPAGDCIDETMSTLDYAHRAKSIKNKPEANQRMTKHVLIKEYGVEIDALRSQLMAARAKDGIFLPPAQYAEMQDRLAWFSSKLAELEDELDIKTTLVAEVEEALESSKAEVTELDGKLSASQMELKATTETLVATELQLRTNEAQLERTQSMLHVSEANVAELQRQAAIATALYKDRLRDIAALQDAAGRKDALLQANYATTQAYAERATSQCKALRTAVDAFKTEQTDQMTALTSHMRSVATTYNDALDDVGHRFASVQKDLAALVTGMLAKVEVGHERVHADQMDQKALSQQQAAAWVAAIDKLSPLTESLTSRLEALTRASASSAAAVVDSVQRECDAMRVGMDGYMARLESMLEATQAHLTAALQDEVQTRARDTQSAVASLTTTKETMRDQVEALQASLKAQLDTCLSSMLQSLSDTSSTLEEQSSASDERVQKLLLQVATDVAAATTDAADQAGKFGTQLETTTEHVEAFAKTHASHVEHVQSAVASHADATNELQAALQTQATAHVSALDQQLASQTAVHADAFNSTTEWMATQFQRIETEQEAYVSSHKTSSSAVQDACQTWRTTVDTLSNREGAHATTLTTDMVRQDEAATALLKSLATDASSGATPRKRPHGASFPTFTIDDGLDAQAASLGSPKRKLDLVDVGASRLQPPKKYLKQTSVSQ